MLVLWILGCPAPPSPGPAPAPVPAPEDTSDSGTAGPSGGSTPQGPFLVEVRLDGQPVAATVYVPDDLEGRPTDASGRLSVGQAPFGLVIASHPAARTEGAEVYGELVVIDLETIDPRDNEAYLFQDPGDPDNDGSTAQCAHCHITINESWFASPHARSASNPVVHDVYAGAAAALDTEAACAEAGGRWWTGLGPGTMAPASRCYLGAGTLPDLDPSCGLTAPCDGVAAQTGGCADCHAPGIDGELGGRDLLEATDLAYTYGVHCDVCHKVESVDLLAPPGVAGALRILRPSEQDVSPLFDWRPLTFGPYADVAHPRMGGSYRSLFHEAELCGACHELHQEVLVPGAAPDLARWPSGRLPVHTTWSEWQQGPLSPASPCQSCHMPPDASVGNSADLGNLASEEGLPAGWYRPPGSVRQHSWPGPRQPELGLVQLAAALDLQLEQADGVLTVQATVSNAGAGHAIPTGEPLRALLLRVEASCDGVPLLPAGGDVLPEWAGALDVRRGGDLTRWPGASVGDRIRVISLTGELHDPPGYGPFGDGTFSAQDKGLPVERWAGEATVVAVEGELVTLDRALPAGEVAYRVPALTSPEDGAARPLAGAPGFAFARVLVDSDGVAMVPHHRAVDVRSDNRLMPQARWTSTHTFEAPCAAAEVRAALLHRPLPWALAAERRWDLQDAVIAEAIR
jgi:hypothetical protein